MNDFEVGRFTQCEAHEDEQVVAPLPPHQMAILEWLILCVLSLP